MKTKRNKKLLESQMEEAKAQVSKVVSVPEYTAEEKDFIARYKPKGDFPTHIQKKDGLSPAQSSKPEMVNAMISKILGTSTEWARLYLESQIIYPFLNYKKINVGVFESQANILNCGLALLSGIAPRNEIETMLGLQMIATHNLSLELMGKALTTEDHVLQEKYLNQATKLTRTFTVQMEALNRNRGNCSQQKVVVEHVHVHQGGQAIVGHVDGKPGEEGGGKVEK